MTDRLEALEASAAHLATLTKGLTPEQLDSQSYPKKWTISDVLSHIGSGAMIMRRGVDAAVSGQPVEDGFNQSVWDEWNAKSPADRATDVLVVDRALLDRLAALTDEEPPRSSFSSARSSSTWRTPLDCDSTSTCSTHGTSKLRSIRRRHCRMTPAEVVIDNLAMIIGWAGKTDGTEREIVIKTTTPSASSR